ncbi:MPPV-250 immunodominant virion protein [Magpiepox virus 2]|nr:immunodominant virion protein [Magpiepox virus]QZW33572.1 MPPV-250 immunodominant virion protein [Magpiepox virus 2]
MENFHNDFIRRIKRSTINDPSIYSEITDQPTEQETLAGEESGEDRSIQSRVISFFRSNNQDGLFDSFLKKIDNTENRYLDQINELDNNTTQPQVTQSTTINQTPQPISASVVKLPTPQTSTLIPPDQIDTTTQLDSNTVSSISSSTPGWIKNIYDKYKDKLPYVAAPVDDIDRSGRQMMFNAIILWITYALKEENINFPHNLRQLYDVIIPPRSN